MDPSRRVRCDSPRRDRSPLMIPLLSTANRSYRSLRDGSGFAYIPGNKLPGYDRSVPPGQIFFLGKGPLCNDPNASASPHLAREFPARVHYFI
jgi:hypothetical protein